MPDLSVLIPSRNEPWLKQTVDDILLNSRADTEVIIILDGGWPVEPLAQHEKVTLVYHPKSVGQRAATNEAARLSPAKYVMKLDAHCSLAEGFDVELIKAAQELGPEVTQIPLQCNLHIFDWMCDTCGFRKYQGPTPKKCEKCEGTSLHKEMVWKPRRGVKTTAWRFDSTLHFQYAGEMSKRPELIHGDFIETMSCLGACWFLERERYWQIGGMDEAHGSWGNMGTELGCKSWLSGGRMVTNTRTWFAHLFRTQGGDFSFPYEIHGSDQEKARVYSRDLWRNNKWPGQKHPLSWMVKKFWPVEGWTEADLKALDKDAVPEVETARPEVAPVASEVAPVVTVVAPTNRKPSVGILYYSDCRPDPALLEACRKQLLRAANGHAIVSVTLAPVPLGFNVVLPLERSILTMHRQILTGLKLMDCEVVYFAEHDLLYTPEHFRFIPPREDAYYYNVSTYKVDAATGRAVTYVTQQLSGLCAYRSLLLDHYTKRVARIESEGFSRSLGFEPGCHRPPRGIDSFPAISWTSEVPNIDVRHDKNLTPTRWDPSLFRNQKACQGWAEVDVVPGWGQTKGRFSEWLAEKGRG